MNFYVILFSLLGCFSYAFGNGSRKEVNSRQVLSSFCKISKTDPTKLEDYNDPTLYNFEELKKQFGEILANFYTSSRICFEKFKNEDGTVSVENVNLCLVAAGIPESHVHIITKGLQGNLIYENILLTILSTNLLRKFENNIED
ncbi:uncharacterized protein LOC126903073 [Daktulosphaira vitifoliae]|uniref:uncharacterized protein LOC126903073 n=1 Tax=Daktulosphaira vitifoliae TaxID=58002 RepID=UPI0021AAF243|nr:uncharacterized protein LOC126903073 [Daktulosphaira vitifoliae]